MNLNLPWFLIAALLALILFSYFSQKAKIRREERQDRMEERMNNLMESIKSQEKDPED